LGSESAFGMKTSKVKEVIATAGEKKGKAKKDKGGSTGAIKLLKGGEGHVREWAGLVVLRGKANGEKRKLDTANQGKENRGSFDVSVI